MTITIYLICCLTTISFRVIVKTRKFISFDVSGTRKITAFSQTFYYPEGDNTFTSRSHEKHFRLSSVTVITTKHGRILNQHALTLQVIMFFLLCYNPAKKQIGRISNEYVLKLVSNWLWNHYQGFFWWQQNDLLLYPIVETLSSTAG